MSCGTARLLETVINRTGSIGHAVRRPYSDSDESDNDLLYAEEHDSIVRQVSLRNEWLTQTADDSCGEGCAQLDDFDWFLPADDRAGVLPAPESEMDVSDSESEVEYIEPDLAPLQIKTMAEQLLCPPVVAQTRPMEGCDTASPWRVASGTRCPDGGWCGGGGYQTSIRCFGYSCFSGDTYEFRMYPDSCA